MANINLFEFFHDLCKEILINNWIENEEIKFYLFFSLHVLLYL